MKQNDSPFLTWLTLVGPSTLIGLAMRNQGWLYVTIFLAYMITNTVLFCKAKDKWLCMSAQESRQTFRFCGLKEPLNMYLWFYFALPMCIWGLLTRSK